MQAGQAELIINSAEVVRATHLTRSPTFSWPCVPSWPSSSLSSSYWPCWPYISWTLTRPTRFSGPSYRRTTARWASWRAEAVKASRRSLAASVPACSGHYCCRSSSSASRRKRWSCLEVAAATTRLTRMVDPRWFADSGLDWNSSRALRESSCCSPRRQSRWSHSAVH